MHRKRTYLFMGLLLILMPFVLLMSIWQQRFFAEQLGFLFDQVEVIVELDPALSPGVVEQVQEAVEQWEGVKGVEYWDRDRLNAYVDSTMFSDYFQFLDQYQIEIPVQQLFRIRLDEPGYRKEIVDLIEENFSAQLDVYEGEVTSFGKGAAGRLIDTLEHSARVLQGITVVVLILWLLILGYCTSFYLSERRHGFHPLQMMHLVAPYEFFPALITVTGLSWSLTLIAMVFASLMVGAVLWQLTLMLWGMLLLFQLIFVWVGKLR